MTSSRQYRVLNPAESYTFSKYFELPFAREEILADLGCTLIRDNLSLPTFSAALDFLPRLSEELERNLAIVDPVSETARREAIVAPILLTVCRHLQIRLNIEYTIKVSDWLKGSLDYFVHNGGSLLVIEAKQSDLAKGFVQLSAELVALDQWTQTNEPILYGAITTGDVWRFGALNREEQSIIEDRTLYQIPQTLEVLVRILIGILKSKADAS
jgi:hypothetical protein